MLAASDVDYLDTGRSYSTQGVMVGLASQRPLYRYAPDDLAKPLPDMAAAAPVVSGDGRVVTVKLRRGVRFSPPVNREVTSRDVAYAFERLFSANVAGPYPSYFRALEGAPTTPTKGVRPLSGISTPDAHTIVFRLQTQTAPTFVGALVLIATAPVPAEYAKPFDARTPSTYTDHVVATGPYMVRNDAQGRVVGYQPGKSIDLVRNPRWSRKTDSRPARLDRIRIRTNATDTTISARQVIAGKDMVLDAPAPAPILKLVSRAGGAAVSARINVGGYRFLPLNTRLRPFDDINVRKAVLAAFDREAVRRARGGVTTGPLATHFLPPGIAGFEEAGGLKGPDVDFLRAPGGDPALAAAYLRKAGFADGRYHGDEKFLLVAGNSDQDKNIAEVVQDQLGRLGFQTRLKFVPGDALFTNWCSVPAKKVLTCAGSIAWLKDFSDPEPMLRPVFDGSAITPVNNTNYSQLDDPKINAAMEAAATTTGPTRARAWGAIDRMILNDAPAIPVQWDVATLVRSKDVAGVPSKYFVSWDLSYTGLR
ncbi:Heme-binding protein A [Baekduia alba]|nr:Heme-binding protein A [Baekduia alba]